MFGTPTEAEKAQRDYEQELDRETARIIREEGIPMWPAMEKAQKRISQRKQFERRFPK